MASRQGVTVHRELHADPSSLDASPHSSLSGVPRRRPQPLWLKACRAAIRRRIANVPSIVGVIAIILFCLFVFTLTATSRAVATEKAIVEGILDGDGERAAAIVRPAIHVKNGGIPGGGFSNNPANPAGPDAVVFAEERAQQVGLTPRPPVAAVAAGAAAPLEQLSNDSPLRHPQRLPPPATLQEALQQKVVSAIPLNPDPSHLHGVYAIGSNGLPLWSPKPLTFRMTQEQKVEAHTGYCFNTRVSDSLPLDRSVPDYNSKRCKNYEYPNNLPAASVIIVFYNENYSVLLRSFHSVLNRTPPELLAEVILVDDFSNSTTHPWLFDDLDNYVRHVPKVVVRHLPHRHGLMMARMAGVEWATAPVVVFLDSHIEAADRWLEPLINATTANPKTMVVPLIHTIDFDDFGFERGHLSVLGFSWSLGQTHPPRPDSDFEPMESPVMAGGLFAANREWFLTLGGYDPEMRLYGGEEMEIGFKTWMCGGRLEALPCSRVGHVFRSGRYWEHQVYKVPGEEIHRNKLRAAAVWMDDYEKIVKIAIPKLPPDMSLGPLESVKAVRERLHCQSFQWYLDHVYPDLQVPKIVGGKTGALRNVALNACVDSLLLKHDGDLVGAYPCHGQHGTQALLHDADGKIFLADSDFSLCLRAGKKGMFGWGGSPESISATSACGEQTWIYHEDTNQLEWKEAPEKELHPKCLAVLKQQTAKSPFDLLVLDCDSESKYQKFVYDLFE